MTRTANVPMITRPNSIPLTRSRTPLRTPGLACRGGAAGRRSAFSLIELLVVIGILAVLIALAVIGFRVVGTAGRERVTDTQMENCKSLLNEFELTNSVGNLLPVPPVAVGHWVAPPVVVPPKPINASTCSTVAQPAGSEDLLMQDTARVMFRLRTVPKNRASLEKMTPDRVKSQTFDVLGTLPSGTAQLLLDGGGRPIYFVPDGGLSGVNRGYLGGDRTAAASYDNPAGTITAPDRRPFWASPGPDSDLTTGDDNLYSFGK